jgi:hypothetical protein
MAPSAPAQRFSFDEKLSHIRSRGIDIHPHLPDNCPKGSDGLPIFGWSINHLLPNHDDASGILQFFGLNQTTTQQVLALYAQDSEPHINHGEAVFDREEYTFPLAQRLFELYAGRRLTAGSYEQSYGMFVSPPLQLISSLLKTNSFCRRIYHCRHSTRRSRLRVRHMVWSFDG